MDSNDEAEPFISADETPKRDLNLTAELMHPDSEEPGRDGRLGGINRPRGINTSFSPRAGDKSTPGSRATPSGRTPSNRQALQDRINNRKSRGESNSNTPSMKTAEDYNQTKNKRKEALKARQLARESADAEDSDSPVKGRKSGQEKEEEPVRPLVTVMMPPHVYPLKILPTLRSTEAAEHPLLVVPAPHPHSSKILSDCFGSLTRCCSQQPYFPHYEELEWGEEEEEAGAVLTAAVRNTDAVVGTGRGRHGDQGYSETERLLGADSERSAQEGTLSSLNKHASPLDIEMSATYQRDEGLFVGRRPLLTSQLMDGEEVGLQIASMVAKDLYLSRITQRILRDICGSELSSRQRKEWAKLTEPPTDPVERKLYDGNMKLLRVVNTLHGRGPVLRVFEDPVDEAIYEPIVDNHGYDDRDAEAVHKSRDLHDMQFSANSTKTDMLGNIPALGGRRAGHRGRRGILRVHVQTINFTRHMLMNEEEKKYIELKRIYANYRVMFEQQATGYLVYRLHALLQELSRLCSQEGAVLDDGSAANAKSILSDVLETLPSLAELRAGLSHITGDLYKCWEQLKEIRKRQKFVSCRAVLIGRPLYFLDEMGQAHPSRTPQADAPKEADDSAASDGEGGNFYQHLEAEVVHWNSMQDMLHDLPDLVESLCVRLRQHAEQKTESGSKKSAVPDQVLSPREAEVDTAFGTEFMASVLSLTKQSVKDLQGQFLPLMVYRLTNLGHITHDPQGDHVSSQALADGTKESHMGLDATEEQRRQDVNKLSVKLVLKVNGRVMTSTEPSHVQWPSYSANILRSFEFRVFKHLSAVTFDVYLCTKGIFGLKESFVGMIPVPLPYLAGNDTSAQNMAPVAGWCSFSATNPTVVKHNQHVHSDRIEGAMLCGSEYEVFAENVNPSLLDGVKTSLVSRFSPPGQAKSDIKSMHSNNLDFTRERDFHKLLPDSCDLDPNDPQNELVMRLKKQFKSGNQATRDTFVLVGGRGAVVTYSENGNSYSNFLKSKVPDRIRLLMMRESRPYLFTEPIPLSEAIIQKSDFYRSLLAEGADDSLVGTALNNPDLAKTGTALDAPLDPIDENGGDDAAAEFGDGIGVPMSKISGFLQRVRDSHTAVSRQSKQKKVATNSVISEPIQIESTEFSFANLFKFTEYFEPKRALKPKPTARKAASTILSSCDLLIQVVGGKNVPLRINDGASAAAGRRTATTPMSRKRQPSFDADDIDDNSSMVSDYDPAMGRAAIAGMARPRSFSTASAAMGRSTVGLDLLDKNKLSEKQRARTFIEVSFQDNTVCTTSVNGAAPNWKQSLSLDIRAPHDDFSPQSMETLQEDIYFTLFDEIIEDDSQRGGYFEDESTERIEKKYLGSFSVPFATVFNQGRVDGVFRLDVPAFNVGYHSAFDKKSGADRFDVAPVQEEFYGNAPSFFDSIFGPPGRPAANVDTSHAAWDLRVDDSTQTEFEYFASGSSATFLKVLITLDPLLAPVVVPGLELSPSSVCPQDRFLVSYAHSWLSQLKSKAVSSQRDYSIFGYNSDGYKVLCCRYLTPQEPPLGLLHRRGCIQLTSMIPFMPDAQAFIGAYDLWCTSKQLWDMGAGDEEEHGITLYNYFLYLSSRKGSPSSRTFGEYPSSEYIAKEENFFVSGRAIPEGDSVYVLCRQPDKGSGDPHSSKNFILINPCTGFVYSTADRNCPMFEITTLATPYNIWANIQASTKPSEMSFDVLNTKLWKPFFSPSFPYPKGGLSTVQDPVQYIPTPQPACVQIEREVKGAIKTKFRRWRSKRARSTTLFHPDACSVVSDHLYLLEEWKMTGEMPSLGMSVRGTHEPTYVTTQSAHGRGGRMGGSAEHVLNSVQEEIKGKLKNVLRKKSFHGYPINIAFTDVNMVVEKVKSMCVHESRHPNVQFVLAVKAFPLVNNLVSLWIFLGTLEENSA